MSKDVSTAATIPQEVVDAITDQLQASKDWYGLKSFGLVQKSWLSSSRRYLFHTISVKMWNIDWLVEILTVPSRSVTPYVRRLVVDNDHDMLLNKILPLAQPLHAVKSLSIALWSWGDLIPEAKENLISVFKHITFLSIHCVDFDSLSQAVHFITSYPYLEELSLMGGYWRSDPLPSPSHMPDQSGLARLKTLRSFTLDHIEILEWFLRCQPIPPLTTIDFSSHGRSEVNVWGRLIKGLGPTLKHLRVCHRAGFMLDTLVARGQFLATRGCSTFNILPTDDTYLEIDLTQNTGLQSIHLESPFMTPNPHIFTNSFSGILSTISSYEVEKITLGSDVTAFQNLGLRDWELIASLLTLPRFSCVKRIHFRVLPHGPNAHSECNIGEALIRERLQQFTSHGILSTETDRCIDHT